MQILIVGNGLYDIYEPAIENSFKQLNYKVDTFYWKSYFKDYKFTNKFELFYYKSQNKLIYGPIINKINTDLIKKCEKTKPDLVFVYRGTHIYPNTIIKIKQLGIKVFGYNNDDPFSNKYRVLDFRLWSLYKASINHYDWIFAYRWKNIDDYKDIGYKNVSLLRSYYIKDRNFYIPNIEKKYDVIFIGHFEDDGRDETIKYLLDNGVKIKLFGTEWQSSKYYEFFINIMDEIQPLYGDDYNKTINQAKISLVFLSKLNNDTYTRRCFEIPATRTMMIAEYTDDLANNLFEEDKDAVYFRNKEELLEKINFYLQKENERQNIGNNGYNKLMQDGHEVIDRCKEIVRVYDEIK